MHEDQFHHPDMKDPVDSKTNGLVCWVNMERSCGTDCMAYSNPPSAKGPDYDNKQWANCTVLVSLHQGAKHIAVLASHLVRQARTPAPPQTSVG